MKKNMMKAALVAVVGLIAGINVFNAQKSDVMSDVAMANVEALADNELTSDFECNGLLGICSLNCEDCGFSWWAIGSAPKGTHQCSQKL